MSNKRSTTKLKISKKEMYSEMVISMWQGNPTKRLIEIFRTMAERLAGTFTYVIEEDRNDVISFAVNGLLERYYKFDFNRDNPFSYFTQTITNLIINAFPELKRDGVSIDAILQGSTED